MSPVNHSEHSRKHRQRTGPQRKGAGNFLPEIFVFSAINTDSDLQLARTAMSPAMHSEHSRKCRQRTGPRKKGAGSFLPVILIRWKNLIEMLICSSFSQFPNTSMLPAEHSRKHRQRTGPRKEGAGNLPVIPRHSHVSNTDSALQLARTDMSPAQHSEHSRKHC